MNINVYAQTRLVGGNRWRFGFFRSTQIFAPWFYCGCGFFRHRYDKFNITKFSYINQRLASVRSLLKRILFLTLLALLPAGFTSADSTQILVQSTTSTQNSGLYDFILPVFEAETGYEVNVVAVGTGQAIRNAQNGDADVLLVHSTASEKEFVSQGFGVKRFDLMYNDFVIIGPLSDPAGLKYSTKLGTALEAILSTGIPFVSRGDDSGTHKKENSLWKSFQHNPDKFGSWYTETGSGMGATIRMAVELNGYTLTDRATWIAYKNKANHQVVFEGDPNLFNQYGGHCGQSGSASTCEP